MMITRKTFLRQGILLEWFTISWNFLEAIIAITAGIIAGSIALKGFGLDSVIELMSGTVLLWRLTAEFKSKDRTDLEILENKASFIVGVTFFVLTAYVLYESGSMLLNKEIPAESNIGIVLAILSLIIMPVLAFGKMKVANRINSKALKADAKETIACSYLSFTLLLGLSLNALLGWWWADPVAALLMIPWLIKEGWELIEESREKK